MKRNYPIDVMSPVLDQDLIRQIVFHEAGHAAAIHLYNKQKQLPPVYFQITIKQTAHSHAKPFASRAVTRDHFVAMVEGGCLIQGLPITLLESANYFSLDEQDTYRTAFEADMINLLVGPRLSKYNNFGYILTSLFMDSSRFKNRLELIEKRC